MPSAAVLLGDLSFAAAGAGKCLNERLVYSGEWMGRSHNPLFSQINRKKSATPGFSLKRMGLWRVFITP